MIALSAYEQLSKDITILYTVAGETASVETQIKGKTASSVDYQKGEEKFEYVVRRIGKLSA